MFIIIILNTLFIKRRFRFLILKNEIIILNNKREIIASINIDKKFFLYRNFLLKKRKFLKLNTC